MHVVRPTDEQQAVIDAARAGQSLRVAAFAGAGKTATLLLLARALEGRRVLYLSFTRALADEAFAPPKRRGPSCRIRRLTSRSRTTST